MCVVFMTKLSKLFLALVVGGGSFLPAIAQAHKTQVVGDIAGIWHIDPNHNPKAGEPARVWVALTRRGGQIVPLSQTNCQMRVFNLPRRADAKPILQPPLTAINAERYQGIPGTNVTFPRVGLYQLELNCTPQQAGAFRPFRLTYDVTVAR
jgi:hypothetical protein